MGETSTSAGRVGKRSLLGGGNRSENSWIRTLGNGLVDTGWLIAVPSAVLVILSLIGGADTGDVRVNLAIAMFLLPGWWLAPRLLWKSDGPLQRFAAASILSFGVHGLLVSIGDALSLRFGAYYVSFTVFAVIVGAVRIRDLHLQRYETHHRLPKQGWLLLPVLVFVCLVWHSPFSNDISQFLPQQIDMAGRRTLDPSAIGMTAFGIDVPMPRWQAHTWHVWISLLANATHLPVSGVVYHWATIPVALIALTSLGVCVSELAGRRVPLWAIALALLGPLTLWFRNYNAYVYVYRLTNNLCLDKDLAQFWLIPAWLWCFHRAVSRGAWQWWGLVALLVPLTIGMHPMTPTYLLLLLPFAVITAVRWDRRGMVRGLAGSLLVAVLFLGTFLSGQAQSAHKQIEFLVQLDAQRHLQTGRPLHYWIGQYAAVPELDLDILTTQWDDGMLQLRSALFTDCSVLLATPFAVGGWVLLRLVFPRGAGRRRDWQPVAGVLAALLGLAFIFATSGWFLARAPYLFRGFERLHWFCYVPGLASFALFFSELARVGSALLKRYWGIGHAKLAVNFTASILLAVHLTEQCWQIGHRSPTILDRVRVLNSLFDFFSTLDYYWIRDGLPWSAADPCVPPPPDYLTENDRVLPLATQTPVPYHELRQAVWWPEVYGEGQALQWYGDPWLRQWHAYFGVVDRTGSELSDAWILQRGVTLIRDPRPGAEESLRKLGVRVGREVTGVAPGVWRLTPPLRNRAEPSRRQLRPGR